MNIILLEFQKAEWYFTWSTEKHKTGLSTIYYCQRSGLQRSWKDDSSRKRRSTSCKLNKYCTSTLSVLQKHDKISVTLYPKHCHHEINFENLLLNTTISQMDKDKISGTPCLSNNFHLHGWEPISWSDDWCVPNNLSLVLACWQFTCMIFSLLITMALNEGGANKRLVSCSRVVFIARKYIKYV